jgi:hypothetical protein
MKYTSVQVSRFRSRLVDLNPPSEVLQKFDRLTEVNSSFEDEDSLEDILSEACRIANWTIPWEVNERRLTFRACLLDSCHPEYHPDCATSNTPAIEQAYRRGVSHGIAHVRQTMGLAYDADHPVAIEERRIDRWRKARLHERDSIVWGGFVEPDHSCQIRTTLRRSGLPPKLRWKVLERDGRRCVACGASAQAGAQLEVDRIVPIAKGGADEIQNLQTLCFDCNRGKSDS